MKGAAAAPAPRPGLTRRLVTWAAGFEDGQILRAAFFGMLAATVAVLAIDYFELSARNAVAIDHSTDSDPALPVLPAFDPDAPGGKPGPEVTTADTLLRQPLTISLGAGGVLSLTGTIDRGAVDRFSAELAQRGEYVKTVALDSPGGSLEDALAIGRIIRQRGYATSVADGAMCASSCPLAFAGGKKRTAGPKAAIGVHQIYLAPTAAGRAAIASSGGRAAGAAMEEAQETTARITRYLSEMGVDPALWLHALDTPPASLYYFSSAELASLKLVTNVNN